MQTYIKTKLQNRQGRLGESASDLTQHCTWHDSSSSWLSLFHGVRTDGFLAMYPSGPKFQRGHSSPLPRKLLPNPRQLGPQTGQSHHSVSADARRGSWGLRDAKMCFEGMLAAVPLLAGAQKPPQILPKERRRWWLDNRLPAPKCKVVFFQNPSLLPLSGRLTSGAVPPMTSLEGGLCNLRPPTSTVLPRTANTSEGSSQHQKTQLKSEFFHFV